ncbi:hypothetical protein ACKC5Q_12920 [Aeromonas dhakensis]|uniref:hypothetical protein n=1 Tax=Aeromonas dhakensis TaxID=196024 RepID=UPI0038B655AB
MSKLLTNTTFLYQLFIQTNLFCYPSDTTDTKFWKVDRKGVAKPSKTMLKQFEKAKSAMCQMVALSVNDKSEDTEDFQFSIQSIAGLFGRKETFYTWNEIWNVFNKSSVHLSKEYAGDDAARPCGYMWTSTFKSKLADLMDSLANDTCSVSFDDLSNAPYEEEPEHDLVTYITPNVNALREAITAKDMSLDERLYVWAYCRVAEHYNGRVPQYYHCTLNSKRYYGFGKLGIQGLNKKLRNLLMQGYNQYDLNASAVSILCSVAQGLYPTLQRYASQTKAFRLDICNRWTHFGLDVDTVKKAITATLFGWNINNQAYSKTQIPSALVHCLVNDEDFNALRSEFNELKDELFPIKKKQDQQKAASAFYQELETRIMSFIRNSTYDPMDCLMVHDCIYTRDVIDIDDVRNEIDYIYGVQIQIKEE